MSEFRDKINEIDKLLIDKLTEDEVIALDTLLIEVIKEDVIARCDDDDYRQLFFNSKEIKPIGMKSIDNII